MTWPKLVREHLAASRRDGFSFERAWEAALIAYPAPCEWAEIAPYTRDVMRVGYYRQRLRGDATMLVENRPAVAPARAPVAGGAPLRCRSGWGCNAEQAEGSRFCARHRDELAAVRTVFEADEAERAEGRRSARQEVVE